MDRPHQSLEDYLAIAISPVLIMALVGSLVFFLLEIFYAGAYYSSLQWILFFFVFAIVLISRISLTEGIAHKAGTYGIILGLLVLLAMAQYVEYPDPNLAEHAWLINLFLMGVIWFSAHQLTWDCTLIDDAVKSPGIGLLQQAGLEKDEPSLSKTAPAEPGPPGPGRKKKKKRRKKPEPTLLTWMQDYQEKRRKGPANPGLWVVYFSLAALPIFGLGQAQIPAEQIARRSYTFWLMVIYSGSGLGLLLTTTFLNLRRELRQRRLHMPALTAGVWALLGIFLIAGVLTAGSILPRPADPQPLWQWTRLSSPDNWIPPWALEDEDKGQDKGKPDPDKAKEVKDKEGKGQKDAGDNKAEDKKKPQRQGPNKEVPLSLEPVMKFLKMAVIVVMVLLIAILLLRFSLQFFAQFGSWAKDLLEFLDRLWAGLKFWERKAPTLKPSPPAQAPFASFDNPFLTGKARGMSLQVLLGYTFAALEAWARQRRIPRRPGETALEFSLRIGEEAPALEESSRKMLQIYSHFTYAERVDQTGIREKVRQFWDLLTEVARHPQSAGTK